jgi:(p)ppGpp synthase/HD superfamily hydrolase
MLDKAISIAAQAHLGQLDRMGKPYILHPLRLMFRFQSETEMIVAVLHDVVEDHPDWDLARLRQERFSEEIVQAIDHVTRREDETYEAFVERTAGNSIALRVKLADLEDNMDLKRLNTLTANDQDRIARYHRAWLRLSAAKT